MSTNAGCTHPNLPPVPFDAEESRGKSPLWVHQHYPRLYQICPDCKEGIVCYASMEHYIALDC